MQKHYELAAGLERTARDRLDRYEAMWKMYRGEQWGWDRGLEDDDPAVTLNYIQRFVDKHVNFLFSKGFTVNIPDDPSTAEDDTETRGYIGDWLNRVWELNNLPVRSYEMGQFGSISGDIFLKVSWEEQDPFEEPYPRVDVIPPQFVFPSFDGPFGVDRRRMVSCVILYPRYADGREMSNTDSPQYARKNRWRRLEENRDIELYIEEWFVDGWREYQPDGTIIEHPNPYGEIPVVHIPNFPIAGEFYGRSDVAALKYLQKELNEKVTDISDVINYHGSPVTVITGARLGNLERGANRMWALPQDATVKNLEIKGDLSASMRYIELLRKSFHELGYIPEGILNGENAGLTGVALAQKYIPLLELRQVKLLMLTHGLRLVNRLLLKTQALKDAGFDKLLRAFPGNPYKTELVFPEPLPRDKGVELGHSINLISSGLSTKHRELMKMGFSRAEADHIIEEWHKEKEEELSTEAKYGAMSGDVSLDSILAPEPEPSGNPNPVQPPVDSRGEAVSRAAE